MAGWGPLEKSAASVAAIFAIESAVLVFMKQEIVTLVVSLLVTAVIVLALALVVVVPRARDYVKMLRDYGIPDGPRVVWHVHIKRLKPTEEPSADSLGPFCTSDLSRMQVGTYAVPGTGVVNPETTAFWVCPACNSSIPYAPGKDHDVEGVAMGRWHRRERSDWKQYRRSSRRAEA